MNNEEIIFYLQCRIDDLKIEAAHLREKQIYFLGENADNEVPGETMIDVLENEISILKEIEEKERAEEKERTNPNEIQPAE